MPPAPLSDEITNRFSIVKSTKPSLSALYDQVIFFLRMERVRFEFAFQLETIRKKAKQLRDDGHITAADKADALCTNLNNRAEAYFLNPEHSNYIKFSLQVKEDIKDAYDELSQHRGWKRLLGNIALAILGFGILYLAAVMINKNIFFNKTDSAEKLDKLESLVANDEFEIWS